MTREIKFRAWDKRIKQFVYLTLEGNQFHFRGPTVRSGETFCTGGLVGWQQYTGLKDKNGREVFEGDLLKTVWIDTETGKTWEGKTPLRATLHSGCGRYGISDCEVIGNIYENPDPLPIQPKK